MDLPLEIPRLALPTIYHSVTLTSDVCRNGGQLFSLILKRLCVCLRVCVWVSCVPWNVCGGQWTTGGYWFSPATLWIPGIKLELSGPRKASLGLSSLAGFVCLPFGACEAQVHPGPPAC